METIQDLITKARKQTGRQTPITKDLYFIRIQLRARRKQFLGSYISLQDLIFDGTQSEESAIYDLCGYLGSRADVLWNEDLPEKKAFCRQFFTLAIYSTCSGGVGGESIDDIIQLASCLVRSKEVFVDVTQGLLPKDMVGELFEFVETYTEDYFNATFEDAVLGAIAVFLGALSDPLAEKEVPHND